MKRRRIFKALSILATIFTLASCAPSEISEFSFKVLPKESYEACEDEDDVKRRIIVTADGKDYSLKDLEEMGASISGLDFSTSGKHTLTISYNGDSLSYEYEVVGDSVITGFEKAAEGIDLDNHTDHYVFGFNSETGKVGLYDKTTLKLSGSNEIADDNVYFVATSEEDFNSDSINSYLVVDNITLTDTLIFNHPVDLIATNKDYSIRGDVSIETEDKVDVKIDTDIEGTLFIDAPNGHIEQTCDATEVIVSSVSDSTYVLSGTVGTLTCSEKADNIVISELGIVNQLITTDLADSCVISVQGTVYHVIGDHEINMVGDGFVFERCIVENGDVKLPLAKGLLTFDNWKITNASFEISNSSELFWFSRLTQCGESPLIKDQPLVDCKIVNDITYSETGTWVPIANWNYWSNGVASRWFATTEAKEGWTENGWFNFAKRYYKLTGYTANWDFVSEDDMYCRAFYNENYTYNGLKVEPIYFIRLHIHGEKAENGPAVTISGLNSAFIGCLSYDSVVEDLNLNYDKTFDEENTKTWGCFIHNNLRGGLYDGQLDTEINTHFALCCNNIYVPSDSDGKPMGSVEFNNVTIGGTFEARRCNTTISKAGDTDVKKDYYNEDVDNTKLKTVVSDGQFVIGAFVASACGQGDPRNDSYITFNNCSLASDLRFVVTKYDGEKEYICQWGSKTTEFSEEALKNNVNYALIADYCCGNNSSQANKYCSFNNNLDTIELINGQKITKISHSQGGYSILEDYVHTCDSNEKKIVAEANCQHGTIYAPYCSQCHCKVSGDYFIEGNVDSSKHFFNKSIITEDDKFYIHSECTLCHHENNEEIVSYSIVSAKRLLNNSTSVNNIVIEAEVVGYSTYGSTSSDDQYCILKDLENNDFILAKNISNITVGNKISVFGNIYIDDYGKTIFEHLLLDNLIIDSGEISTTMSDELVTELDDDNIIESGNDLSKLFNSEYDVFKISDSNLYGYLINDCYRLILSEGLHNSSKGYSYVKQTVGTETYKYCPVFRITTNSNLALNSMLSENNKGRYDFYVINLGYDSNSDWSSINLYILDYVDKTKYCEVHPGLQQNKTEFYNVFVNDSTKLEYDLVSYSKVDDPEDISVGDKLIFVYNDGSNYYGASKNGSPVQVTMYDNKIYYIEDTMIFDVLTDENNTLKNTFYLKYSFGYKTTKYLFVSNNNSAYGDGFGNGGSMNTNTRWTFTLNPQNQVQIDNVSYSTYYHLRFDSTNNKFGRYLDSTINDNDRYKIFDVYKLNTESNDLKTFVRTNIGESNEAFNYYQVGNYYFDINGNQISVTSRYEKVNSKTDFVDGDEVAICGYFDEQLYAVSNTLNVGGYTKATDSSGVLTLKDNIRTYTLRENTSKENYFSLEFKDTEDATKYINSYLDAVYDSIGLKTTTKINQATSDWTFDADDNGVVSITNRCTTKSRIMMSGSKFTIASNEGNSDDTSIVMYVKVYIISQYN